MCFSENTYFNKTTLESKDLRCRESSFFSKDNRTQAFANPTGVLISVSVSTNLQIKWPVLVKQFYR